MAKKIKLSDMKQATGNKPVVAETKSVETVVNKLPAQETKASNQYTVNGALTMDQVTSVTSLLSRYKSNPYINYASLTDYTSALNKMSLSQLHNHCVEVAHVIPIDNRDRLTKRLETEFAAHFVKGSVPTHVPSNLTTEGADKVRELLRMKK